MFSSMKMPCLESGMYGLNLDGEGFEYAPRVRVRVVWLLVWVVSLTYFRSSNLQPGNKVIQLVCVNNNLSLCGTRRVRFYDSDFFSKVQNKHHNLLSISITILEWVWYDNHSHRNTQTWKMLHLKYKFKSKDGAWKIVSNFKLICDKSLGKFCEFVWVYLLCVEYEWDFDFSAQKAVYDDKL